MTAQMIWQRRTLPLTEMLLPRVINVVLGQVSKSVRKSRSPVSMSVRLLAHGTLRLARLEHAALLIEKGR